MLDESFAHDELKTPQAAKSRAGSAVGNQTLSDDSHQAPSSRENDEDGLTSTAGDELDTVRTKVAMIETRIGKGGLGTIDSCATTREFLRRSSIVRNSLDEIFRDTSSLSADASPNDCRRDEDFSPRLTCSEGARTPGSRIRRADSWTGAARRVSLCAADSSSDSELSLGSESRTPSRRHHEKRKTNHSTEGDDGIHAMYESAFDLDWSSEPATAAPSNSFKPSGWAVEVRRSRETRNANRPDDTHASLAREVEKSCSTARIPAGSAASERRARPVLLHALLWTTMLIFGTVLLCSLMMMAYWLGMRSGLQTAESRTGSEIFAAILALAGAYPDRIECDLNIMWCHRSRLDDLLLERVSSTEL